MYLGFEGKKGEKGGNTHLERGIFLFVILSFIQERGGGKDWGGDICKSVLRERGGEKGR